jgi:hypothetical protein
MQSAGNEEMAAKSFNDGTQDPVVRREQGTKWRVENGTAGTWANREIILEVNSRGHEKLTVVKDGVRISAWTKKGFSIKPPK